MAQSDVLRLPPLSLYIHTPWCERKCPYCDFNSFTARRPPPEKQYIHALLADLESDLPYVRNREIKSIFIGGGTPSLLNAETIASTLEGVRDLLTLSSDVEITLEANPGSADAEKFAAFRQAGINRLSLGIQSFDDEALRLLGRTHSARQAQAAFEMAREAGFDNVNLDLMFALPGQDFDRGIADIEQLLLLAPEHISYYQLTVEPNTLFYARPPKLPNDELSWHLETRARQLLHDATYTRYEISSYARDGYRCRHNVNYWEFGDYLGIGSGAHAKLTLIDGDILRLEKHRHPNVYLNACRDNNFCAQRWYVNEDEVVLEFMINAMRLVDGFDRHTFETRTNVGLRSIEARLATLQSRGLIKRHADTIRATESGIRFLNEIQSEFLPDEPVNPAAISNPQISPIKRFPATLSTVSVP